MITQESLLKSHYYNPETGTFYRRLKYGELKPITTKAPTGYLSVRINYKSYLGHRLVWLYMTGEWPAEDIDHIDGNRANNKWTNLRAANVSENQENLKRARCNNLSTGLLGVNNRGTGKFTAKIKVKGVAKHLGTFDTPEEAHEAYIKAKRELHLFNTL